MRLRKNEIISILSESRLAAREFIHPDGSTCAVGALVRAVMPPNAPDEDVRKFCEMVAPNALSALSTEHLIHGDWLSALSSHFETMMFYNDDVYDETVREEIINFVRVHFPSELVISV